MERLFGLAFRGVANSQTIPSPLPQLIVPAITSFMPERFCTQMVLALPPSGTAAPLPISFQGSRPPQHSRPTLPFAAAPNHSGHPASGFAASPWPTAAKQRSSSSPQWLCPISPYQPSAQQAHRLSTGPLPPEIRGKKHTSPFPYFFPPLSVYQSAAQSVVEKRRCQPG